MNLELSCGKEVGLWKVAGNNLLNIDLVNDGVRVRDRAEMPAWEVDLKPLYLPIPSHGYSLKKG